MKGDLSLRGVLPWVPLAAARGVSQVARGPGGFVSQLRRARTLRGLPEAWRAKRAAFIARHVAEATQRGEPWWKDGEPTRRHLALLMWAYTPTPERTRRARPLA